MSLLKSFDNLLTEKLLINQDNNKTKREKQMSREDQNGFNTRFMKVAAFQKIATDSKLNLMVFEKWIAYHKQMLSFKQQKPTSFKALLPDICVSNVKESQPQPFVDFIEEYRDSMQQANRSWFTNLDEELRANLYQSLTQLKNSTHKINSSIGQIENSGEIASQKIEQMFQTQIQNEQKEAQSIGFYLKQKWEERIQRVGAFLETAKSEVNEQVEKLKESLEDLSSQVTQFRKIVLKFISALIYSYLQVSHKLMVAIRNSISLTTKAINMIQQEFEGRFSNRTISEYIKGLRIIAQMSRAKKKPQQFEYREIQKIFWNQQKELADFKEEKQILDKYASTRLELHVLTKKCIQTIEKHKNNKDGINKNIFSYLKEVKSKHNLLYQTYSSKQTREANSFRIKWPDDDYRWLWEQIQEESMAAYFLSQNNKINSLKIQIKKYLQYTKSVLTKLDPTIRQQCNIYKPAYNRGCIEISQQKVIIYNSTNCLIIPRSSIIRAQIKRSENLKIIIRNGLKVKINKFKDKEALCSVEKKLNQKVQQPRTAKANQKEESSQTLTERKVLEEFLKLSSYRIYKSLSIELSIKQVFRAIFDDSQPWCVDKTYSTFFAYLCEKSGDKDYSSEAWKVFQTEISSDISIETLTRKSKMTHFLPKIPFIPKTCQCQEDEALYWLSPTHLIYLAQVNLLGSSLLENLTTKTVYEIKETSSERVEIKLYGKAEMKEDGKFGGVIKNGAESDMVKIMEDVGDELGMALQKYKQMHKNIK